MRNVKDSSRGNRSRRGVTVVEMALVVPFVFTLFFASLEFSRANMLRHTIQSAAYEGARAGIVPGATVSDATDAVNRVLNAVSAVNAAIEISPPVIAPATQQITVSVSLPLDDNGWVVPRFFAGRTLTSEISLAREQVDDLSY